MKILTSQHDSFTAINSVIITTLGVIFSENNRTKLHTLTALTYYYHLTE